MIHRRTRGRYAGTQSAGDSICDGAVSFFVVIPFLSSLFLLSSFSIFLIPPLVGSKRELLTL